MSVAFHFSDENAILREQLEYLIGHTDDQLRAECAECQRYRRVRSILLEVFSKPTRKGNVVDLTKAAGA